MGNLILLRHGQSAWNQKNLFSGWVDIPLSTKGVEEARLAGEFLKNDLLDVIYTSTLIRSQMTACLVMAENGSGKIPCMRHEVGGEMADWYQEGADHPSLIPLITTWRLNERMYGQLQGKNKAEMVQKYGAEQVQEWRRSFRGCPPGGESLEATAGRTIPFFTDTVMPQLQAGKNVFICAHGNSLRSIVMHLENLTEEEVLKLEIPTGGLRRYRYAEGKVAAV